MKVDDGIQHSTVALAIGDFDDAPFTSIAGAERARPPKGTSRRRRHASTGSEGSIRRNGLIARAKFSEPNMM